MSLCCYSCARQYSLNGEVRFLNQVELLFYHDFAALMKGHALPNLNNQTDEFVYFEAAKGLAE